MKKALFLDRDGTINEAMPRGTYLTRLSQWQLLPGIKTLISAAVGKGYLVFVVTNQPQVTKGLMTADDLAAVHALMNTQLGNPFSRIYLCPHEDLEGCGCRKPRPGMLEAAIRDFGVDPTLSLMVGDSYRDVLVGQAVGAKTVFLKNEHNAKELPRCNPDHVIDRLQEAVILL